MFRSVISTSLRSRILNGCARSFSMKVQKKDEPPSFKSIAVVAVIGSIIFVQAVKSLEKTKPKTNYSESEYVNIIQGLKRKVSIFKSGYLKVHLLMPGVPLNKIGSMENAKVINPAEVVEHYRNIPDDKYEALLNNLHDTYGEEYLQKLPNGALVMLLGRYMKEVCHEGDEVYIKNFPETIKDAIKFENEVCVVSSVLTDKGSEDSPVVKYFQTVNKVNTV
ncbi:Aim36p Ecym_5618 [Eremothecium cymbalariae DBVPG|uniref:Altered inheritance of mitochondria protein 36, mitochondrial n=1 Tax=Eremothecium cymbalariae (strain CBS 270.75 / DBVPG 7215 / KCTC 17166 / NRRL Y-17582) TaxID=931890 RepID=I6NE62_ERECY|nr:hypothetical protein Ecym_5618 [Eremothecium cymbalariae DBVPG\